MIINLSSFHILFRSRIHNNLIAFFDEKRTVSQLCSERDNGWRLPVQKELLRAYIDGAYWNLTNPANNFWSFDNSRKFFGNPIFSLLFPPKARSTDLGAI